MFNTLQQPDADERDLQRQHCALLRAAGCTTLSSNPTLTNVIFSGNTALYYGGGCTTRPTAIRWLTNVTFSGNTADSGGGMYNVSFDADYPTYVTLANVILWGDSAATGAEIYNAGTSTSTVTYSDVQGGYPGTGNLNADPLFVDAANGNLRLQDTSPAIDAGDNLAVPVGVTTDLDGKPRFVDTPTVPDTGHGAPPIVDMGAYEVQQPDELRPRSSPSPAPTRTRPTLPACVSQSLSLKM